MQFIDSVDGEYEIHAGSLEIRAGQGYLAAVIVHRIGSAKTVGREVYRDTEISGGHRWPTSDLALQRALQLGARAVAAERHRSTKQVCLTALPMPLVLSLNGRLGLAIALTECPDGGLRQRDGSAPVATAVRPGLALSDARAL